MQFTKQSFMGIELDILIGHPEHDILFIATQVARAAGLKDPATAVSDYRKLRTHEHVPGESLQALIGNLPVSLPKEPNGRAIRKTTVLFTEPMVYQMLLRGHAPASEPFRKWVTEVVLPSIRKTGKFDVNEAQDETSKQFAEELAALHAEIAGLVFIVEVENGFTEVREMGHCFACRRWAGRDLYDAAFTEPGAHGLSVDS